MWTGYLKDPEIMSVWTGHLKNPHIIPVWTGYLKNPENTPVWTGHPENPEIILVWSHGPGSLQQWATSQNPCCRRSFSRELDLSLRCRRASRMPHHSTRSGLNFFLFFFGTNWTLRFDLKRRLGVPEFAHNTTNGALNSASAQLPCIADDEQARFLWNPLLPNSRKIAIVSLSQIKRRRHNSAMTFSFLLVRVFGDWNHENEDTSWQSQNSELLLIFMRLKLAWCLGF